MLFLFLKCIYFFMNYDTVSIQSDITHFSHFLLGLTLLPNFEKSGDLEGFQFLDGVAAKEGVTFFRERGSFYIKK